jgi:signal transduction histidine kinase
VKYTPAGGMVSVELERGPEEYIVTVRDNGVGIAEEHKKKYSIDSSESIQRTSEQIDTIRRQAAPDSVCR